MSFMMFVLSAASPMASIIALMIWASVMLPPAATVSSCCNLIDTACSTPIKIRHAGVADDRYFFCRRFESCSRSQRCGIDHVVGQRADRLMFVPRSPPSTNFDRWPRRHGCRLGPGDSVRGRDRKNGGVG